jgi:hypothetical protein
MVKRRKPEMDRDYVKCVLHYLLGGLNDIEFEVSLSKLRQPVQAKKKKRKKRKMRSSLGRDRY